MKRAVAIVIGVWLMGAMARATSMPAPTAEEAALCAADAFRLCAAQVVKANRAAVVRCIRANKKRLSGGCRTVFTAHGL